MLASIARPLYATSHLGSLYTAVNAVLDGASPINQYDVQCIIKVYDVRKRPEFFYKSSVQGSPSQYSQEFVDWLPRQYKNDNAFFAKARQQAKSNIGLLNHLFRRPVPAELRRGKMERGQKGGEAAFDLRKGFIHCKLLAQMRFTFEPNVLRRILLRGIGREKHTGNLPVGLGQPGIRVAQETSGGPPPGDSSPHPTGKAISCRGRGV